jgi:glycerophosphoryl diester phosphodiesterase
VPGVVRRIGHKGADAIAPGNTIPSYEAAVDLGVDLIELDVVRPESDFRDGADWRRAMPGPAPGEPLLNAHDWGDARRRDPMTMEAALDAFTRPPLDSVQIDLDLKLAGREDEVVAALRERGLVERAMTSTMEIGSVELLRDIAPELRAGWTYPRVSRDWMGTWWGRVVAGGALPLIRRRLPRIAGETLPRLGVWAMWVFHPLISRRLAATCDDAGIELIAWTVDDLARMKSLARLGVDGICTNDPRLFSEL